MSKWLTRGGLAVAPLVVVRPFCPESHHEPATHEHVPHEDHRPVPTRAIIGFEMGSSSSAVGHAAGFATVNGIGASIAAAVGRA